MEKKYKITRASLLILQFVFLVVGFGSTIVQLVRNASDMVTSNQNEIITIISFVAYLSLIFYAIWGYKKKYVPYRIAITLYLLLTMTTFVRMLDIANAGKQSFYIFATCFFVAIIMILTIAYDNTFKDHKTSATVIGFFIVLMELMMSVSSIVVLRGEGLKSVLDIMSYQPFARFIISSVLYASFIARTQWRNHDKKLKGEI